MNLDGLTEEQKERITNLQSFHIDLLQRQIDMYRQHNTKAAQPKYKFVTRYVVNDYFTGSRGYTESSVYQDSVTPKRVHIFDRSLLVNMYRAWSEFSLMNCSLVKYERFLDTYLANEKE